MGYLERNEPLPLDHRNRWIAGPQGHLVRHKPLLPGRFCAVQRGPQPPAPAAHASAGDGFRAPAKATDEDVRLTRRYQGGTRFVEDDWQETPRPARWPATVRGRPPSRTVCAALQTACRGQRAREVERGAAQWLRRRGRLPLRLAEGAAALAPTAGEVAGTLAGAPELVRQRRGWPWASQAAQPTASRAARAGCWRTRAGVRQQHE